MSQLITNSFKFFREKSKNIISHAQMWTGCRSGGGRGGGIAAEFWRREIFLSELKPTQSYHFNWSESSKKVDLKYLAFLANT